MIKTAPLLLFLLLFFVVLTHASVLPEIVEPNTDIFILLQCRSLKVDFPFSVMDLVSMRVYNLTKEDNGHRASILCFGSDHKNNFELQTSPTELASLVEGITIQSRTPNEQANSIHDVLHSIQESVKVESKDRKVVVEIYVDSSYSNPHPLQIAGLRALGVDISVVRVAYGSLTLITPEKLTKEREKSVEIDVTIDKKVRLDEDIPITITITNQGMREIPSSTFLVFKEVHLGHTAQKYFIQSVFHLNKNIEPGQRHKISGKLEKVHNYQDTSENIWELPCSIEFDLDEKTKKAGFQVEFNSLYLQPSKVYALSLLDIEVIPHCDGTKQINALMVGKLASGKTEGICAISRALDPDTERELMKVHANGAHGTFYLTPVKMPGDVVTYLDTLGVDTDESNWKDLTIRAMIEGKVPENWNKDDELFARDLKKKGREIDTIVLVIASNEDPNGKAVKKLKKIIETARQYRITPVIVVTYLPDEDDRKELKSYWSEQLSVPKERVALLGWNDGMGTCEIDRQASKIYVMVVKAANAKRREDRPVVSGCAPIPSLFWRKILRHWEKLSSYYLVATLILGPLIVLVIFYRHRVLESVGKLYGIFIGSVNYCVHKVLEKGKKKKDGKKKEVKKKIPEEGDEQKENETKDGENKVVCKVPVVDIMEQEAEENGVEEKKPKKGKEKIKDTEEK